MAVQFISMECPKCGAPLQIEAGRKEAYCSYCGAKVLVVNDNEYVFRHIDEAGVIKAETERMVQMKQMEIEDQKRVEAKEAKSQDQKYFAIALVVGAAIFLLGTIVQGAVPDSQVGASVGGTGILVIIAAFLLRRLKNNDSQSTAPGNPSAPKIPTVRVPDSVSGYQLKSYQAIESILYAAGFTNIRSVPLNDLVFGVLIRPGFVQSISIGGKDIQGGGKKFRADAPVVISYHSKS